MDIVLALAAAFLFALGLVLQEKAASAQSADTVGAGFLARLAHQPVWLLGLAVQGLGFVAQAIALGIGRMVVVQLLVSSIVLALPLGRLIEGRPIRRPAMVGAALVAGGLAALLLVSKPAAGDDDASLRSWAVVGGASLGLAVLLFVLARDRSPAMRAGLLGTAGGILFGLGAALTKTTVSMLDDGVLAVLGDWTSTRSSSSASRPSGSSRRRSRPVRSRPPWRRRWRSTHSRASSTGSSSSRKSSTRLQSGTPSASCRSRSLSPAS